MRNAALLVAAIMVLALFAVPACADTTVTHLTETEFLALDFNRHFVAEGRIGSNSIGGATFEYDLGEDTGSPYATGEFVWSNGCPVDFSLSYDGMDAVFGVGQSPLLTYTAGAHNVTDIFIRTRAEEGKSTISVSNLDLDGPLAGVSSAPATDYLWIRSDSIGTFNLTGESLMTWIGDAPRNSALAYQIKVGEVVPEPGSLAAMLGGIGGLAGIALKRRR